VNITFTSALIGRVSADKQSRKQMEKMTLELVYPLDEAHLLIHKPKRSFRASKPAKATVTMEASQLSRQCDDLTFSF